MIQPDYTPEEKDRIEELMNETNPTDDDLNKEERQLVQDAEKSMKKTAVDKIKRIAANTAITLYNATIAEITPIDHNNKLKMIRIPIIDTIYRKLYYTYLVGNNQSWNTSLFDEATAEDRNYVPYIKGGGKKRKTKKDVKKRKKHKKKKSLTIKKQ